MVNFFLSNLLNFTFIYLSCLILGMPQRGKEVEGLENWYKNLKKFLEWEVFGLGTKSELECKGADSHNRWSIRENILVLLFLISHIYHGQNTMQPSSASSALAWTWEDITVALEPWDNCIIIIVGMLASEFALRGVQGQGTEKGLYNLQLDILDCTLETKRKF